MNLFGTSPPPYVWIGLYAYSSSSTYWYDGTPYDYSNFGTLNFDLKLTKLQYLKVK